MRRLGGPGRSEVSVVRKGEGEGGLGGRWLATGRVNSKHSGEGGRGQAAPVADS